MELPGVSSLSEKGGGLRGVRFDSANLASMVVPRRFVLFFILFLALPAFGLVEEGGTGLGFGSGGAFKVTAPHDWVFDNEDCRRAWIGAVIYPVGEMWNSGDALYIACKVSSKRGQTLSDLMAQNLKRRMKSRAPGLESRELPALTTKDGRKARVREFKRNGLGERVAYIDTPEAVCVITLTAPGLASWEQGVPAFAKVVGSFEFFEKDSSEYLARRSVERILRRIPEIQDPIKYVPDENWRKYEPGKPGVSIYTRTKGDSYGVIAHYDSKTSEGDSLADYEAAWEELARPVYGVGPAPVPTSTTFGQLQVKSSVAELDGGGQSSTVMLTVFSGFGKSKSLLANFNDSSFAVDPKEVAEQSALTRTLPGDWASGTSRSKQMVNGKLVDTGFSVRIYSFLGDGEYIFRGKLQLSPDHYVLMKERGTISVKAKKLTFHGQGGTRREVRADGTKINSRPLPAWERTYTFELAPFEEQIHGPGLVLRGVKENDLDGAHSSFYPESFVYVLGYHPGVAPPGSPIFREFWRD